MSGTRPLQRKVRPPLFRAHEVASHVSRIKGRPRELGFGHQNHVAAVQLHDTVVPRRGNVQQVERRHELAVRRQGVDCANPGGVEELDPELWASVVVSWSSKLARVQNREVALGTAGLRVDGQPDVVREQQLDQVRIGLVPLTAC